VAGQLEGWAAERVCNAGPKARVSLFPVDAKLRRSETNIVFRAFYSGRMSVPAGQKEQSAMTDSVAILATAAGFPADKPLYEAVEAGRLLGRHPDTIRLLHNAGQLPGIALGKRRVVYPRDSIAAYLANYNSMKAST
jgi:hypothetical protein